jgi:hypothetical protein
MGDKILFSFWARPATNDGPPPGCFYTDGVNEKFPGYVYTYGSFLKLVVGKECREY